MLKQLFRKYTEVQDQLLDEIGQTKLELDNAYANFQNVVDPDLIDSYIYQVNSVQKRYTFLLNKARQLDM